MARTLETARQVHAQLPGTGNAPEGGGPLKEGGRNDCDEKKRTPMDVAGTRPGQKPLQAERLLRDARRVREERLGRVLDVSLLPWPRPPRPK